MSHTRVDPNGTQPPPMSTVPQSVESRSRSPLQFVFLVVALSTPLWLLGAATSRQLLPSLPVSSLMAFCPMLAAAILVHRTKTTAGVIALLKRSCAPSRIRARVWYAPTLLLMPCIMATSYVVMRLTGVPLPALQLSVGTTLGLGVVFFIAAVGEESGWSGYAIDPLQDRFGALGGALLLGVVWACWHVIPLLQAHRTPAFIAWWSFGTVASRVIITWLYNNTGRSVFVAVLFHALMNLTWQLFPTDGSHYDPRVTSPITAAVAALVTVLWGPQTLVRARSGPRMPMRGARIVGRSTTGTGQAP